MTTKVSKPFRVATSGPTVDGRSIPVEAIKQMAANYNPKKYSARVWCEHMRGLLPDSIFKALGDVVSVEAKEVEGGKWALFASISPTDDLVAMNKDRQKMFSSIEIMKDPDTQEAYLGGLAVTDSPASLGTEMLQFNRKHQADRDFTDFLEGAPFELGEEEPEAPAAGLFARVKEMLSANSKKQTAQFKEHFADIHGAVEAITTEVVGLTQQLSELKTADETPQGEDIVALREEFNALVERLDNTLEPHSHRPPQTGGDTHEQTDC